MSWGRKAQQAFYLLWLVSPGAASQLLLELNSPDLRNPEGYVLAQARKGIKLHLGFNITSKEKAF